MSENDLITLDEKIALVHRIKRTRSKLLICVENINIYQANQLVQYPDNIVKDNLTKASIGARKYILAMQQLMDICSLYVPFRQTYEFFILMVSKSEAMSSSLMENHIELLRASQVLKRMADLKNSRKKKN
jgi:hypothetical protein